MPSRRNWLKRTPLYMQVANYLREEIQKNYESGQRLDAESRLAQRLRVSLTTIREALSSLAQEGVLERRHGSGTYVRNPLGDRHIGILIDMDISHSRTSYFFLQVVQQLRAFFEDRGYKAKLYVGHAQVGEPTPTELTCQEFLDDTQAEKLAGVIAVATNFRLQWMEPLIQHQVAVIGGAPDFSYSVGVDYEDMVRKGAEHLARMGCQRAAMIATGGGNGVTLFREVLQAKGVTTQDAWICQESHPGREGAGWNAFQRIWTASETKPDGLLVCDDFLFQEVAMAILDARLRVPNDLQIVTHAVQGASLHCPFPVTRLELDLEDLVQANGEMLLRLMAHQEVEAKHLRIAFTLRHSDRSSERFVLARETQEESSS